MDIMSTSTTTTTTNASNASTALSQKESIVDLCTIAGEAFSKFGILIRDLTISNQRLTSDNEQEKQLIGWDDQSVTMFRQAVLTFGNSVRDISTVVAEKRVRER